MSEFEGLHVGVVTGERKPELTPGARAFVATVGERGGTAEPVVWTDGGDWTNLDVAVLRSCWAYHERVDEFRTWLAALDDAGVTVLNPLDVVRWNVHKFYLRDLADAGVPVLETVFVERGSDRALDAVLADREWREVVVKPAVGTSSAGTWRTRREAGGTSTGDESRFASMVVDGDVLVQQFAPEIRDGERSLVFLGGEYSHARLRRPADGDFRAHPAYGGSVEPLDPAPGTLEQVTEALGTARDVLDVSPADLPYARMDGVLRDDEFRVMELELVEPYLGLADADGAVPRFADAIEDAL